MGKLFDRTTFTRTFAGRAEPMVDLDAAALTARIGRIVDRPVPVALYRVPTPEPYRAPMPEPPATEAKWRRALRPRA